MKQKFHLQSREEFEKQRIYNANFCHSKDIEIKQKLAAQSIDLKRQWVQARERASAFKIRSVGQYYKENHYENWIREQRRIYKNCTDWELVDNNDSKGVK